MGSSRGVAALSSPSALLRRSTVAVLLHSDLRRSAARLERPSCTNRSSVESTTMARITMVASWSSVRYEISASTVSSTLNGFL